MLNSPITAMVQAPIGGGEAAVDQIGRQMHGDERKLEAAGEEAEHEQCVGAMAESLGQRLLGGLLLHAAELARRCRGWRARTTTAGP